MSLNVNFQDGIPDYQTQNPTDPVVQLPTDVLIHIFNRLNAQEFSNSRFVSKLWHFLVLKPDFANKAHWYPQLSLVCKQLSQHISDKYSEVKKELQSIIKSPEMRDFESYRQFLIFALAKMPEEELERLSSLNLPLPEAYKSILNEARKIYYSYGGAWASNKQVVGQAAAADILKSTGVKLPEGEAFYTFRVEGAGRKSSFFPNIFTSEADKTIPEMFPFGCLNGKNDGDILDFTLIDGRRFLHRISGHGAKLGYTIAAIESFNELEFSPALLGHVLLPNLLDQLKVSAAIIGKKLIAEIDHAKYPEFKGKLEDFLMKVKTLEKMPDLDMLQKELKAILETLEDKDLEGIKALNPETDAIHPLEKEEVVRIPEGWETIVKEILARRRG